MVSPADPTDSPTGSPVESPADDDSGKGQGKKGSDNIESDSDPTPPVGEGECAAEPSNVAVGLTSIPTIDGVKEDSAWSSATKIPMFKASKSSKEVLGTGMFLFRSR